jgi:hypothetical protein
MQTQLFIALFLETLYIENIKIGVRLFFRIKNKRAKYSNLIKILTKGNYFDRKKLYYKR